MTQNKVFIYIYIYLPTMKNKGRTIEVKKKVDWVEAEAMRKQTTRLNIIKAVMEYQWDSVRAVSQYRVQFRNDKFNGAKRK